MCADAVATAIDACGLVKTFGTAGHTRPLRALDGVSFGVPAGSLVALVGPDGAGKTTLIRLVAGLLRAEAGTLRVLGLDVARDPQAVQDRIGYMPQRFGLYEDLSVQENLDLYADLHGVPHAARAARYRMLMRMTDLGGFSARPAGKLSGGMKQKLGLACALVRAPELLLLDEPTVGVDPLSRRELWRIIGQLVGAEGFTVLVSTAYLDEAERCDRVLLLRDGALLAAGTPARLRERAAGHVGVIAPPAARSARTLQARLLDDAARVVDAVPQAGEVRVVWRHGARAGASAVGPVEGGVVRGVPPRLEDGFMVLLDEAGAASATAAPARDPSGTPAQGSTPARDALPTEPVIEVSGLVRRFGDFTAVADTSFVVLRGEVFGLLGPNGAGKTTTFRMLCGLLPATAGTLRVAGADLRTAGAAARRRIGYVSQRFGLYPNLSVAENLRFFAGAYGLRGERAARRIEAVVDEFGLDGVRAAASGALPGGFRQRLAMAAALLHEPDILFLDEPTSGADPLARRRFWRRITALTAGGTTVVVTTHFMEEAEYCDRILIQDAGRVLAEGTPAQVRAQAAGSAGAADRVDVAAPPLGMEDVFIRIVECARRSRP